MTDLTAYYNFRDDLIQRLKADVVGPIGGMDEILDEDPATAYVMGVLYPQQSDGFAGRPRAGLRRLAVACVEG